ncbi:hypothetical protein LOAG_12313 [Loa loa]|uniref:Uncharacterized protein n=1 Tax=Loa loa TaxID=7209 RepID=A0A1S0TLY0_LOALO|nr:hypothetical protein LOAG_12313 [Loa loa]EFO16196.1 hypothetical protein LOAG_12313 [Loa loa]
MHMLKFCKEPLQSLDLTALAVTQSYSYTIRHLPNFALSDSFDNDSTAAKRQYSPTEEKLGWSSPGYKSVPLKISKQLIIIYGPQPLRNSAKSEFFMSLSEDGVYRYVPKIGGKKVLVKVLEEKG